MAVFWVVALSVIRAVIALMMEAVRTSETLINLPDYTALQPRRQPSKNKEV
jgi:hypothetical protein